MSSLLSININIHFLSITCYFYRKKIQDFKNIYFFFFAFKFKPYILTNHHLSVHNSGSSLSLSPPSLLTPKHNCTFIFFFSFSLYLVYQLGPNVGNRKYPRYDKQKYLIKGTRYWQVYRHAGERKCAITGLLISKVARPAVIQRPKTIAVIATTPASAREMMEKWEENIFFYICDGYNQDFKRNIVVTKQK